jgi:tetratricopeptide (TPR) repeat protein
MVLHNDFTNWDDPVYVRDNFFIRSLSPAYLLNIFGDFHQYLYKPLTLFSLALEYRFFGLEPFFYHLDNLFLHLINCLLVFWLVYLLCSKTAVSFLTSLLFGIHPMHVESVAWVSERKDLLYGLFFLLALISWLYYLNKGARKYLLLALLSFFFCLLAKPLGIMLPLVLVGLDFLKNRSWRANLREKLPFFFLAGIILGINIYAQHFSSPYLGTELDPYSRTVFIERFPIASYAIGFYLWKLFLPLRLSCYYPCPARLNGLLPPVYFLSLLILPFLGILISVTLKYTRKPAFGIIFFLLSLAPVLQLVPSGPSFVAERYTYISYLGIFYLLAEGLSWVLIKAKPSSRVVIITVLVLWLGSLAILSHQRSRIWKDSFRLWNDCLENYPSSLAYQNRGYVYVAEDKFDLAIRDFTRSIELNPRFALAYLWRGISYRKQGKIIQAIADFDRALEIIPLFASVYYNRGIAYFFKGEDEKAEEDFSRAQELGLVIPPDLPQRLLSARRAINRQNSLK